MRDKNLHLHAGRRYTHIREPYFFSYVEDLLQQEYGADTVRSGGLKVYTTINPALQRAARAAITRRAQPADGSGVGDRVDRPAHRSDPRDGGRHSRPSRQPVQLRHERARQPGSTFKTVALTRRSRWG